MSDIQDYARRLAARAAQPLFFDEAERLIGDLYADVGKPFPTDGDPDAAMGELVPVLQSVQDPLQLGRSLLFAGYLLERGASASVVGPLVVASLPQLLAAAARALAMTPTESDPIALARLAADEDPDAAAAILGLEPAITGAMAILCRDRPSLRALRSRPRVVDLARSLGERFILACHLAELLDSSDEQRLIVIAPGQRRGVAVIADGVRNGFHLFVLLEAALTGTDSGGPFGGTSVPAIHVDVARGVRPPGGETMRAHFDYFNWSAWGPSGFVADAPTRWIWGDLPVSSIPIAHDERIILVAPPQYERTWDAAVAAAVHPDQHPNVSIEHELTTEAVERWLWILANAPDEARQRMRYAGVDLG